MHNESRLTIFFTFDLETANKFGLATVPVIESVNRSRPRNADACPSCITTLNSHYGCVIATAIQVPATYRTGKRINFARGTFAVGPRQICVRQLSQSHQWSAHSYFWYFPTLPCQVRRPRASLSAHGKLRYPCSAFAAAKTGDSIEIAGDNTCTGDVCAIAAAS